MAEWKSYKGEGPWSFVKGPNKYTYNEGDSLSVDTNPVWVADSPVFGATPVTPTHRPCGYWHDGPAPIVPISATFSPAQYTDAAWWGGAGSIEFHHGESTTYSAAGQWIVAGYITHAFIRFRNVTIPQGATLTSAYVSMSATSNTMSGLANFLCYFNNADNPIAPVSAATANALAVTTSVAWNAVPIWVSGVTYSTPSLVTPLQQVINRAGWASGNSAIFILKDNSSAVTGVRTYSQPGADGPFSMLRLLVTYTT